MSALNDRVGHYQLDRPLGQGGLGRVFLARKSSDARPVALKLARRSSAEVNASIRREISTLAHLGSTIAPGVIQLRDSGVQDGLQWFAMSWIEGPSLARVLEACTSTRRHRASDTVPVSAVSSGTAPAVDLRSATPLARAQLLPVIRELAMIVGGLHARGVVHGDLKPANVLLGVGGLPVLIDFGNARRAFGDHPDRAAPFDTARVFGTRDYMAPEQAQGRVDPRTDVYAFGCILYEVLWGVPYSASAHQASAVSDASQDPAWRSALEPWLERALQPDSRRRPQSLDDLVDDMDRLLAGARRRSPAQRLGWCPFVGRAPELAQFEERLSRALKGSSALLGIEAEAGTGRTRLANEMAARAQALGVQVTALAESAELGHDNVIWTRLQRLGHTAGLRLLLVDDLHRLSWSDQQHILEFARAPSPPRLVVATWATGHRIEGFPPEDIVHLAGLGRDAMMELGRSLLGAPLSLELLDLLSEYTEGNVSRIRSLLEALLRDGSLERRRDGTWHLGPASGRVVRNATQIFAERVEALSAKAQALLQVCNLFSDEFDREELGWLTSPLTDAALDAALRELIDAGALASRGMGLLRLSAPPAPARTSDVHDYAKLAQLYAGGCGPLESREPRHRANLAGMWARAGHHLPSMQLFCRAADGARQRRDRYQARVWYRRALVEWSLCAEDEQTLLADCARDCRESLAELLASAGDYTAADENYEAALLTATETVVRARLLRKRGSALSQARLYEAAEAAFLTASTLLESAGSSEYIELTLARFWHHYYSRRQPDALPQLLSRLGPIVAGGSSGQRAEYHHCMAAWHQWKAGYTENAQAVEHARLAWAIVSGDSALAERRGLSLFYLGFPLLWAGGRALWPEAAEHLRSAVLECGEVDQRSVACSAQVYLAVAMRRLGQVEETRRAAQDALTLALEVGSPGYRGAALACLCWVEYRTGQHAAARQLASQAMRQWQNGTLSFPFQWLVRFPLAELQRMQGEPALARDTLLRLSDDDQHRLTGRTAEATKAVCTCTDMAQLEERLRALSRVASIEAYL